MSKPAPAEHGKHLQLGHLVPKMPPIIARKAAKWITGGGISPKTMCHDDQHGKGPKKRMVIGGQVYYDPEDFVEYLERKGVILITVPEI